jgi:hypothetical protein
MKILIPFVLCVSLFLVNSCNLLPGEKDDSPDGEDPIAEESLVELYETGNDSFPLLVIDNLGNTFGFSQDLDSLYLGFPNEDQWMISFDENLLPKSALIQHEGKDWLIYFSEFQSDKSNLVVVNQQTGESSFAYNVNFDGIQEAVAGLRISPNMRPGNVELDFSSWYNSNKTIISKMGGAVMTGVSLGLCGLSIEAAVVSGGLLTAVAVLNCGSFASSFVASKVENKGVGVVIKSGAGVGKYAEAVLKCTALNKIECLKAVVGGVVSMGGIFYIANKAEGNKKAAEALALFEKSGGLAGRWKKPVNVKVKIDTTLKTLSNGTTYYAFESSVDSTCWEYEFGANNKGYVLYWSHYISQNSNSLAPEKAGRGRYESVSTAKLSFDYSILTNNELKREYKEQYNTKETITYFGRTYKEEGPFQLDDNETIDYSLSDDYLKLTIDDITLDRELGQ